jgi:hypothetical protein
MFSVLCMLIYSQVGLIPRIDLYFDTSKAKAHKWKSKLRCDRRPFNLSWCCAPCGADDHNWLLFDSEAPSLTRRRRRRVNLRPTVSRPVWPGVRGPSATSDQFFFLVEISFKLLLLCYFVAPSLTRRRVCNLLVQFILGLARAVTLGSKSRRTHGHILLSSETPPNWSARFPYLYPPLWREKTRVIYITNKYFR